MEIAMKKILFAASECVPFIKTGGLADVCGALPKEFDKNEWDVRVVIPNYSCIPDKFRSKFEYVAHFYMSAGSYITNKYVGILKYVMDGITYYFIDNQEYFNCAVPYGDVRYDIEKFCFFDKAVLSMLKQIDFCPDIIHCHDWQTGLIPVYLKNEFQADSFYWGMKSIMTIHNLKFQGVWDIKTMQGLTGFSASLFTPDKLEFKKDANMLKGGLVYADYITTVSDSYAQEIQTEYYGEGLNGLLSARHFDMQGIVNGIDIELWNPNTDPEIPYHFNKVNIAAQKKKAKMALQEELGLEKNPDVMMVGVVSRLTWQKGFYLLMEQLDALCAAPIQLVILGSGESQIENKFRELEDGNKGKICFYYGYNESLAHRIYAASDLFLMPSLFEPCGISQLCSMRYGTLPLVRETGGLKDTVDAYNEYEKSGNGFSFENYDSNELIHTLYYACDVYYNRKEDWEMLQRNALNTDVSWQQSAKTYSLLYDELVD